jgi:hypothetical protein
MDIFKKNQFNDLLTVKGERLVSIYSPTHRESTDNYQADKILFKNQLQEAAQQLSSKYELSKEEAKSYLKPGYDLLDNPEFWQNSSDALVFLLSSTSTYIESLPLDLDSPATHVGQSLMLRPLMTLLDTDRFYILNLNLKDVRLYEATANTIAEVELDQDVPTSIEDYLMYVEREESLQFRSGQGGRAGAMFHGQGVTDTEKEDIKQYFHELSRKMDDILQCDPLPTVLAGVEYLIPIYLSTSKYNGYEKEYITGSYSGEDSGVLHDKGWEVVEPSFETNRTKALERYGNQKNGDWASSDTNKVILAAMTGQVDVLFVQEDATLWGVYDEQRFELQTDQESTAKNNDLLTEAAIQTFIKNGTVYQCTEDEMPEKGKKVVALFRNPVSI